MEFPTQLTDFIAQIPYVIYEFTFLTSLETKPTFF